MKAVIELKNIYKSYRTEAGVFPVLKGLNLTIEKGELTAIMGPSGSGKSTLLNILGLLDGYDEGEYILNGQLIRRLNETQAAQIRNRELGFVFQSFNLLSDKTALENVALPLYHQGVGRGKRNQKALEYLKRFGLADKAESYPNQLSGGQKQRVAIARALVTEPAVVLADEPTGALDSQNSQEVVELLQQINQQGVTIIVITHEPEVAAQTGRTIRLLDGQIVRPEPALV